MRLRYDVKMERLRSKGRKRKKKPTAAERKQRRKARAESSRKYYRDKVVGDEWYTDDKLDEQVEFPLFSFELSQSIKIARVK